MTLEQMLRDLREETIDAFPVVDFPDKEQTHHSYPCYLNVFQAVCVQETLDQHTANTWKAAYGAGHADALRTIPVFESNNLK